MMKAPHLLSLIVLLLLRSGASAQNCSLVSINGPESTGEIAVVFKARLNPTFATVTPQYHWKVSSGTKIGQSIFQLASWISVNLNPNRLESENPRDTNPHQASWNFSTQMTSKNYAGPLPSPKRIRLVDRSFGNKLSSIMRQW
jgi:hypothetical protein